MMSAVIVFDAGDAVRGLGHGCGACEQAPP